MRKIAVSLSNNQHIARTTTCVNLAAGLARKGYRVLLVDTDPKSQANLMLGICPSLGLLELLKEEPQSEEALVMARENLWLLAGNHRLVELERSLERKEIGSETVLKEGLAQFESKFDYIILDTPSTWGPLMINALFCAQEVLIPIPISVNSLYWVLKFQQAIEHIRRYNDQLSLGYVLPVFLNCKELYSIDILQQLYDYYGEVVCPPIRYSTQLPETPALGQTIFEYAPLSAAALDYQRLAENIEGANRKRHGRSVDNFRALFSS
jgi:chromosome partitioning protein